MKVVVSRVVEVGAIANPVVSDRKLIPYLTIDCSGNRDLEFAIEAHSSADEPGDVTATWALQRFSKKSVFLKLEFQRPGIAVGFLEFDLQAHGFAVEWIRSVYGAYLQSLKYGSRLSEGMGAPAILVEVPHTATFPSWNGIYEKALRKKFRNAGVPRSQISSEIVNYKARMRELWYRFSVDARQKREPVEIDTSS
ncbi:hypothetical protein QMZ25_03800 [Stenotrophomonas sp. RS-48]|uniref:hypothetical protein n=1 Tax=Stenotrophomonas sp. RS-48 TaxID=3043300 RepID=UPI0024B5E6F2|nr:hypothetical protein [Stenotrophomonas sp. RS-48]MDI9247705.1 hypothetical protein [Stenotrophomonas sp. RS-48]